MSNILSERAARRGVVRELCNTLAQPTDNKQEDLNKFVTCIVEEFFDLADSLHAIANRLR